MSYNNLGYVTAKLKEYEELIAIRRQLDQHASAKPFKIALEFLNLGNSRVITVDHLNTVFDLHTVLVTEINTRIKELQRVLMLAENMLDGVVQVSAKPMPQTDNVDNFIADQLAQAKEETNGNT
ncbi:hypothetical protein D1872_72820 [compost metagenome]